MSADFSMNKNDFTYYLNALAKDLRKRYGKAFEAEIIVVGGGAIVSNYSFREMTADIDAIIRANAYIKDSIHRIADQYHIPDDWLNSDFVSTDSYSPKLVEVSKYYRTFGNGCLSIRIVDAEYLVAMKLRSFRPYKKDLSDIVGIISEHQSKTTPLLESQIFEAYRTLYGEDVPAEAKSFVEEVYKAKDLNQLYSSVISTEEANKNSLVSFEKEHPNVLNEENLNDILAGLRSDKKQDGLNQTRDCRDGSSYPLR